MLSGDVGVVDFPTLADLLDPWTRRHCQIPDGFRRGQSFSLYDWQFWVRANFYRIRPDAQLPEDGSPIFNQAFVYRRGLVVGPQKLGKGPDAATLVAAEAVGPSQFAGWASGGEPYRCEDNGCGCTFTHEYLPGDPMGRRHPSPLIQLTATSQEQVDNVYRPLVAMIHTGPLKHLLKVRENFIRVVGGEGDPDLDRIDAVTSSALSRLGNPISFALQDETGVYTTTNKMRNVAETQRRGAAGMLGRTIEYTNCWDPTEDSVAQRTFEGTQDDVFKFWRNPDRAEHLKTKDGKPFSFKIKAQRRKILEYVYAGSDHINLDSIEAEVAELMATDPAQAERFFGNRLVSGRGAWLPTGLWESGYGLAS